MTTLAIGGCAIGFTTSAPAREVLLDEPFIPFVSDVPPHASIDVVAGVPREATPRGREADHHTGGVWRYYHDHARDDASNDTNNDAAHVFTLTSPPDAADPYEVLRLDADLRAGTAYCGSELAPLRYPMGLLLYAFLLGRQGATVVHACGIDDAGRGLLFAGNSGHGKTTMARLWGDRARLLCDDRIVLRVVDGEAWMYSTPWHGEMRTVTPEPVPLSAVFFLRHHDEHAPVRLAPAAGGKHLITRAFIPYYDAAGTARSLELCGRIAETVPCYELGFAKDPSVVDAIRCLVS